METFQGEAPQTIGDTGISRTLLEELALKILFLNGEMSLADLADQGGEGAREVADVAADVGRGVAGRARRTVGRAVGVFGAGRARVAYPVNPRLQEAVP